MIDLQFLACLLALATQQREFKPDEELVFIDKDPLELHVFLPEGWEASDKRAAAVFFFGGGWVGGTPTQFFPHSRYLASRGMVAISAQYRTRAVMARRRGTALPTASPPSAGCARTLLN